MRAARPRKCPATSEVPSPSGWCLLLRCATGYPQMSLPARSRAGRCTFILVYETSCSCTTYKPAEVSATDFSAYSYNSVRREQIVKVPCGLTKPIRCCVLRTLGDFSYKPVLALPPLHCAYKFPFHSAPAQAPPAREAPGASAVMQAGDRQLGTMNVADLLATRQANRPEANN